MLIWLGKDNWIKKNLSYVRYRPKVIFKVATPYFDILEHHHYTDDRVVNWFDSKHYYFPGKSQQSTCTNLNTYLLTAKRKQNRAV